MTFAMILVVAVLASGACGFMLAGFRTVGRLEDLETELRQAKAELAQLRALRPLAEQFQP